MHVEPFPFVRRQKQCATLAFRTEDRRLTHAHGFTAHQLARLVRFGFAAKTTERVVGGGQTFEVARLKITEAGRQACGG